METERDSWKCSGHINKYDRPCPQKLGFFRTGTTPEEMLLIKSHLQIKCPRCGALDGGQ